MIAVMSNELVEFMQSLSHTSRSFAAGAFVVHRGDPVETLHVVRSGSIRLVRYQSEGQAAILQRAESGDILAEASVFSSEYHCDGVATTNAETYAYAVADIRHLLDTDIGFCRAWAAAVSHQLQAARKRAELVSLRAVAERLDAWLAWNEGGMPSKGRWKAVAEEIGVSPEALYREISVRRRR
jgi:CRP-like cAMP-binding protein